MKAQKLIGTVLTAVMLSGGGFAIAKVHFAKEANALRADQEWVYDTNAADPTDPNNYTQYTGEGGLDALCEQESEICGIKAPMDTSNPGSTPRPKIDSNLEHRIDTEDTSQGDVFLLPQAED